MNRPQVTEYADYYDLYISQVPDGDVLSILDEELRRALDALSDLPVDWETYRYEPGKWSIREVLGHVVDVERVFGFRALSFARADPASLPSMDQDVWASGSNAADRPLAALLDDLTHARRSNIAMFESFDDSTWDRSGIASGCEFSVRACLYIIAGHEIHHRRVLEERYLETLRQKVG